MSKKDKKSKKKAGKKSEDIFGGRDDPFGGLHPVQALENKINEDLKHLFEGMGAEPKTDKLASARFELIRFDSGDMGVKITMEGLSTGKIRYTLPFSEFPKFEAMARKCLEAVSDEDDGVYIIEDDDDDEP